MMRIVMPDLMPTQSSFMHVVSAIACMILPGYQRRNSTTGTLLEVEVELSLLRRGTMLKSD